MMAPLDAGSRKFPDLYESKRFLFTRNGVYATLWTLNSSYNERDNGQFLGFAKKISNGSPAEFSCSTGQAADDSALRVSNARHRKHLRLSLPSDASRKALIRLRDADSVTV
jgi:hypothetical protein